MANFTISPINANQELNTTYPANQAEQATSVQVYEDIKKIIDQECEILLNTGIDTPLKLKDRAFQLDDEQKKDIKFIEDKMLIDPDSNKVDDETFNKLIKVAERTIAILACESLMLKKVNKQVKDILSEVIKKF